MSRKSNRLKNRLRIERERKPRLDSYQERLESREDQLRWNEGAVARRELALREGEAKLKRAAAMRISVEEDRERPYGPVYICQIAMHPQECRRMFALETINNFADATYYARAKGHEVGRMVERAILDAIEGKVKP